MNKFNTLKESLLKKIAAELTPIVEQVIKKEYHMVFEDVTDSKLSFKGLLTEGKTGACKAGKMEFTLRPIKEETTHTFRDIKVPQAELDEFFSYREIYEMFWEVGDRLGQFKRFKSSDSMIESFFNKFMEKYVDDEEFYIKLKNGTSVEFDYGILMFLEDAMIKINRQTKTLDYQLPAPDEGIGGEIYSALRKNFAPNVRAIKEETDLPAATKPEPTETELPPVKKDEQMDSETEEKTDFDEEDIEVGMKFDMVGTDNEIIGCATVIDIDKEDKSIVLIKFKVTCEDDEEDEEEDEKEEKEEKSESEEGEKKEETTSETEEKTEETEEKKSE